MKIGRITIAVVAVSCVAILSRNVARSEEEPKKITLALVGTAHIHTPAFVKLINARPDARVKYVWDPDAERAKQYAAQLHAEVAENVEQVCSDPEVSGVVIFTQTNRHRDLVLAAAKAHKHLFVEKPLGINAKESDEMAKAIEQAGVLFTTGYFNRCLPAHLFLKEQIEKGNLGKITRVRASNCHDASLGGWLGGEWQWMTDPKVAGVGAFGDLGTHMLDILMWMFGDVQSTTADIKVAVGKYGDTDECGEALFRFKSGVTGTLAAGWADVENPVTLLISGTEGHAVIFRGKLYFKSSKVPGANGQQPWTDLPAALPAPINLFVDAIGGKTGLPLVTPREAAARVRVMEAMYEGAKTQAWVAPR
jgi:1,5-anhydro-D-fructose reductase (1,5-anhydro-D-mannitol-forming)